MNINTQNTTAPFTPAQMLIMKMYANPLSENDIQELNTLLLDFLRKKIDADIDKIWDEREMSEDSIDDILNNKSHIINLQ